jgi:DNA-binding transcriptional MerR regulator
MSYAKDRPLSIGVLAEETGCKVPTIRYYEKIGLMPAPIRTEGNQRRYGPAHVDRLGFIRHGRELGFPLGRIREILTLGDKPDRSCAEVDRIARDHLAAVEARIARLTALKEELQRMVTQCGTGKVADCRVIEVLADYTHDHCLHDDHGTEAA